MSRIAQALLKGERLDNEVLNERDTSAKSAFNSICNCDYFWVVLDWRYFPGAWGV
jgi:hypothetical protein